MQAQIPREESPHLPQLAAAVKAVGRRAPLVLSGLGGSGMAWLAARLGAALAEGREAPRPSTEEPCVVLVTESHESAERLQRDMAFFAAGAAVRYFPPWDTLPYDNFSPQEEFVAQRLESLAALLDGHCPFLVTTPQALLQGMIPPERLEALRFSLGDFVRLADIQKDRAIVGRRRARAYGIGRADFRHRCLQLR